MKNNEFFNNMRNAIKNKEATYGEQAAFWAWRKGIEENQDFPIETDAFWEKDFLVFLKTIEAAGFKKLGFSGSSTLAMSNLVAFVKKGWRTTGTFKYNISNIDGYRFSEGLILEKD